MELIHTTSLVFVGGQFSPAMFDERDVFNVRPDPDQVRIGQQIGQFTYLSGKYQLQVTSERIELMGTGPQIVSNELVEAGQRVVQEIEPARKAVQVSGLGMNCHTVFDQQVSSITGKSFCSRLVSPDASTLVRASSVDPLLHLRFIEGALTFSIRLEPQINSRGQNLYVAVNGHQDVNSEEQLNTKLSRVDAFRAYIEAFHQRITKTMKGG